MYSIKFHFKAGQRAQKCGKAVLGKGPPRSLACLSGALCDGQGNTNLNKSWTWDYLPVGAGSPQCSELE